MKKSIIAVIILVLVLVVGAFGYYFANQYAQKKAQEKVENVLKKAHLEKDVSYKSIKANLFSKNISISGVEWSLKKHGTILGKVDVKKVLLSGKPGKLINAKFYRAVVVNLNAKAPEELMNKPILTIEEGSFQLEKNDGKTDSKFTAQRILINEKIFGVGKKSKKIKTVLQNIIKLNKPIAVKISTVSDENTEEFAIKEYKRDWKDNIETKYSLELNNIDIKGLKKAAENLKKENPNPLAILNYMSKIYQVKPELLKIEIKNRGLITRLVGYLAKEQRTSKENLIKQLSLYLSKTPFKAFSKPIIIFAKGKKNELKIKFVNFNHFSVGDIIQKMQTEPLYSLFEINVSN